MARAVEIVEVGPRDGLQNEKVGVSTADKVALIERSIAAGVRRIEVASFVNPAKVPQMADAEAVVAALPRRAEVTYIGLVLNQRGADRALAAGIDELGSVCVASDRFAIRNQGQTSAESRGGQITIAAAFGCPFEGEVSPDLVVAMAIDAVRASPREVALADTIGVAVPARVSELVGRVVKAIAPIPVRVHFHDTRNTGIANVWAAVQAGAASVDASLGGLGGCPFAPTATGNVATEDVAYLFERSDVSTGLDFSKLIEASAWLSNVVGKPLPAALSRAGGFP
jgi:hydroxymethylglutaryl-CoA lyase